MKKFKGTLTLKLEIQTEVTAADRKEACDKMSGLLYSKGRGINAPIGTDVLKGVKITDKVELDHEKTVWYVTDEIPCPDSIDTDSIDEMKASLSELMREALAELANSSRMSEIASYFGDAMVKNFLTEHGMPSLQRIRTFIHGIYLMNGQWGRHLGDDFINRVHQTMKPIYPTK